jgi:hypothetical protein
LRVPADLLRPAIVLGGAQCFDDDLARLEEMIGRPWPWTVVGVNDHGYTWPRRLHHWATLHPGNLLSSKRWAEKRRTMLEALGRSPHWDACRVWAPERKTAVHEVFPTEQMIDGQRGSGSSGRYAMRVARHLGCWPIILVGVPIDQQPNRFRSDPRWKPNRYLDRWSTSWGDWRGVAWSMSGWTARNLGEPTPELLETWGMLESRTLTSAGAHT